MQTAVTGPVGTRREGNVRGGRIGYVTSVPPDPSAASAAAEPATVPASEPAEPFAEAVELADPASGPFAEAVELADPALRSVRAGVRAGRCRSRTGRRAGRLHRHHLRRSGPAPGAAARAGRARLRGADADPARGDPAAAPGPRPASGRPRRAPARRRRSRCRVLQRIAARRRAVRRRWCSSRPASWRSRWPRRSHRYGRELGARVLADLRRPADRPADPRARSGRRRRRRDARPRHRPPHPQDARARRAAGSSCSTRPTRCWTWASPRTSRRSWRRCPPSGRPCCSRPRCRRGSTAWSSATSNDPVKVKIHRESTGADDRAGAPGRLPRAARPQAVRARSAAGRRVARRAAIVFCRTREEVDTLSETLTARGLPLRGTARRHDAGPARPGDAARALRARPNCSSPPTSRPAASTSTTSPTSSTTTCRRRRTPTCTASAGSAAPAARAWRSRWSSRASTGC